MKKKYLLPIKILDYKGNFNFIDSILKCDIDQPSFWFEKNFSSNGGGYIVLDFGVEINGGIRIVNQGSGNQNDRNVIRVRFGESVSEVMSNVGEFNSTNNHSPRDFEYLLPDFSNVEFGNTGFRFVRIDFPNDINQRIYSINAVSYELAKKQIGYFKSSDEELNKIFDVAARTAKLCVTDYIVDGIKRDRLVWAGDLLVELKSLNYLFGNISQVKKTLLFIEKTNPMPSYIQNMPTYNLWYLACVNEYFKHNGFDAFVKQRKPYLREILSLINKRISSSGLIDFDNVSGVSFPYFIDWRTANCEFAKQSNPCFYLYVLKECKELLAKLGLDSINESIIVKLLKFEPEVLNVPQFDCYPLLASRGDKNSLVNSIICNGEAHFSPFSYIFVLNSIFDYEPRKAIKMFKNYNMAMVNLGATTFFEEFDYSWKDSIKIDELPNGKFNFLTDCGEGCYKGLRKSLCHGWASGPVSFIIENIVGFKGVKNNTVIIKPFVGNLDYFDVSFVCSLGTIKVSYKNHKFTVKVPQGVEYEIIE